MVYQKFKMSVFHSGLLFFDWIAYLQLISSFSEYPFSLLKWEYSVKNSFNLVDRICDFACDGQDCVVSLM